VREVLSPKAWDTALRQRALDLDGTTDAFAMFEREKWNMYRYGDPEMTNHQALLNNCAGLSR